MSCGADALGTAELSSRLDRVIDETDLSGVVQVARDGHVLWPATFPPGTSFSYCDSGYVLLAILIEVVTGRSYYDVIQERVFAPAGMRDTAFLRLDQLPDDPGISFRSAFEPRTTLLYTVLSNTTDGAWPVVRELEQSLWRV